MTKMHANELKTDEPLVRTLLQGQCLKWAKLPLLQVASSGTDHALFRLGKDYVVRLPRIAAAAAGIEKEYAWVPRLSHFLQIPISKPLFKGSPTSFYPWSWSIHQWNEGHNPSFEYAHEYTELAKDLAHFLNELHAIELDNGPLSRRGIALQELDAETKAAIHQLKNDFDVNILLAQWEYFKNIPGWNQKPLWIHGDFLPGNILVQENRLSAVIDFSDVGMGDPACDCIIAWSLLNPYSRKIFRDHLENIDDDTWERSRGWALSIACIMLPYYKNSNPVLVNLARGIIRQCNSKE